MHWSRHSELVRTQPFFQKFTSDANPFGIKKFMTLRRG
jgi:hypothetical protein